MDILNLAVAMTLTAVTFGAALLVLIAGVLRLTGRRSRLEGLASTLSSATTMGVYPPSLRGGGPVVPRAPRITRKMANDLAKPK